VEDGAGPGGDDEGLVVHSARPDTGTGGDGDTVEDQMQLDADLRG
jgi:hypothetical protein